jgi:putative two-component system response regulator
LRLKAYQDELAAHVNLLEGKVQEQRAEVVDSRMDVVWRLGKAAEHRDDETSNHVVRVGCISRVLAETLRLDREFIETLFVAAPLHDIGKIAIPDSILWKPGPLDDQQWAVMRRHCTIGARILREENKTAGALQQWLPKTGPRGGRAADNPVLRMAADIALMHHEKWDGTGYPSKLAGAEIAIEARIVAIADVFDVLNSPRPYRAAYREEEAIQIISDTAACHFDPQVYAAFQQSLPRIRSVREQFSDGVELSSGSEGACYESSSVCG